MRGGGGGEGGVGNRVNWCVDNVRWGGGGCYGKGKVG